MWIATIDFMKASDSISDNSIWNAFNTCGIEQEYISLLKRLFKDHKATILTDKESDMFEIKKKTNHSDPFSNLLFNTALKMALESDFPRWQKKKNGHVLGRLRVRLPHKFTIFWRRAPVCDFMRTTTKNVWIQTKHRKGGTQYTSK